MKFQQAEMVQF